MLKKLLSLILGLTLAVAAFAQVSPSNPASQCYTGGRQAKTCSVSASDIQYWIGTGSNSAILVVSWAPTGTPNFAWGFHWNGTMTADAMMDSIAAADSRLSINNGGSTGSFVSEIAYTDDTYTLDGDGTGGGLGYWMYMGNNHMGQVGISGWSLSNGDVIEWAYITDFSSFDDSMFPTITITPATDPNASTSTAVEADIDPADILYWVGSGSNSARFIVNWADTALAWGYHFNGTSTAGQMMTDIAAADPRFSFEGSTSWITDILFVENGDTLRGTTGHYWMSNINGVMANTADAQTLVDGDMFKFGDDAVSVWTDSSEWDGVWYASAQVWTMTVNPVSVPSPEDATIAEDDILFWIGQGNRNYTLIVNWADTALAWGYHSWMDSVTVEEIMGQVMVNDSRFSYTGAGGFITDINFTENGRTFGITPGQYWSYNINGSSAQSLFNAQYVYANDVVKWGDPSVATVTDSMEWGGVWYPTSMVWTMPVNPASVVEPEHGPFCGAVGTDGCEAIPATSTAFVGWAATCELELGYQDIAEQGPRVSYGEAADAVGACDTVDNLSVVSLGDGGVATLTFDGHIYNGEGPDFAVFENSFNDSFLELAFVEVSSDGEHFVRFPATSLTQTLVQVGGIGTIDPTFIDNLAGKYRHGWGTPFDLDDLRDSANIDINNITHVRIVDVVGSINPEYATYDAFGNIVNDPYPTNSYSSGFDLDGVGVIHLSNGTDGIAQVAGEISLYPNPATDRVRISYANGDSFTATVYDLSGRVMIEEKGANSITINTSNLANGVYMVRINDQVRKLVVRH